MEERGWIARQVEWLKSFISEADGKGSHKRLISVMIAWVFVFNYNRIAWSKSDLLDVPDVWAMLLAGIIGLGIAATAFTTKKNGSAPPTQ